MTDHLVATEYTEDRPSGSVEELTQKASWHLAGLARVLEQLNEVINVTRPHTPARTVLNADVESQLTPREQEVIGLLVQGLSNRRIARALRISESTVKNHLRAVFLKLNVSDRTQAIAAILGGQHRH
jgi:DNA-binding NarL/FixJ family response regulator